MFFCEFHFPWKVRACRFSNDPYMGYDFYYSIEKGKLLKQCIEKELVCPLRLSPVLAAET
jgi:hypothetical protein